MRGDIDVGNIRLKHLRKKCRRIIKSSNINLWIKNNPTLFPVCSSCFQCCLFDMVSCL